MTFAEVTPRPGAPVEASRAQEVEGGTAKAAGRRPAARPASHPPPQAAALISKDLRVTRPHQAGTVEGGKKIIGYVQHTKEAVVAAATFKFMCQQQCCSGRRSKNDRSRTSSDFGRN